jgi:hypothetical protein
VTGDDCPVQLLFAEGGACSDVGASVGYAPVS